MTRAGSMSEVAVYLTLKAAEPREWLRRKPRTTHPDILALVRQFEADGGVYNEDAERYVNERAGGLPPHQRHGADRGPILDQLGSEVYLARCVLADERARAKHDALLADGFMPLEDVATLKDGHRYTVRTGTLYVGQSVPQYGRPLDVRARVLPSGGVLLLPRGARTRGYLASTTMVVKPA